MRIAITTHHLNDYSGSRRFKLKPSLKEIKKEFLKYNKKRAIKNIELVKEHNVQNVCRFLIKKPNEI